MVIERKTIGITIAAIVIVAVVSGLVGYYMTPKEAEPEETFEEGYAKGLEEGRYPNGVLKVALLGPMTGTLASEGEGFKDGAEWAVEEINALGGICGYKIELVIGDTEDFEPAKVTTILEKMINDEKVAAVFSGYGSQGLIEFEVCSDYDMIYFIGADWMAHMDKFGENPEKYKTCFNVVESYMPHRWFVPKTLDKYAKEGKIELINNKVAIVYSDNYYSSWIAEGLKETFVDFGYEISLWEMVPFGAVTEWGPILAKIRADPPSIIINTDYIPSNEAAFVEQFLENPTKSHMFIQYAPLTPEFVELLGEKCSGVLYNLCNIGLHTAGNKPGEELIQRSLKRFGYEPPLYAFNVYQQIWIYKQGCELANAIHGADPGKPEDRLLIAQTIAEKTAWVGSSGLMVFDETHCLSDRYAIPTLYQLWAGERLTVEPEQFANAEIRHPPWWEEGIS